MTGNTLRIADIVGLALLALGGLSLLTFPAVPVEVQHHQGSVFTRSAPSIPAVGQAIGSVSRNGPTMRPAIHVSHGLKAAGSETQAEYLAPASVSHHNWGVLAFLAVPVSLAALLVAKAWASATADDKSRGGIGAALAMSMAGAVVSPAMAADVWIPVESPALVAPAPAASRVYTVAAGETLTTFYGLDTPPTSYGGYGGNANEPPKYSFQYPDTWKFQTINKVQKGTQGIDSKFFNPADKTENCFAITLARAGESLGFAIRDVDSTFQGFAAADYDIGDALENADEVVKTKRTVGGQDYFDYDIVSEPRYLATVTVKQGKVYAFFIRTPSDKFAENEDLYRNMLLSFTTLDEKPDN